MHVLLIALAVVGGLVALVVVGFAALVGLAHLLAPYYDPS